MNGTDNDPTWVYHALKGRKIVTRSEAEKLYRKGWHDTHDPKVLFSGIRGKWYKLLLFLRERHTNAANRKAVLTCLGVFGSIASIISLVIYFIGRIYT